MAVSDVLASRGIVREQQCVGDVYVRAYRCSQCPFTVSAMLQKPSHLNR